MKCLNITEKTVSFEIENDDLTDSDTLYGFSDDKEIRKVDIVDTKPEFLACFKYGLEVGKDFATWFADENNVSASIGCWNVDGAFEYWLENVNGK